MTNTIRSTVLNVGQRGPTWFSQPWWGGDTLAARQYTLLRILALGQRERLDIVPLIFGLAIEHRGYYRRLLLTLATRINAGANLVAALEQTPDALSDEDVLALRLAAESGTWTQTFDELLKVRVEDQRAKRLRPRLSVSYWLVVLFMAYSLLTLLMTVVAPTFAKLGSEMGLVPPQSFLRLYEFAAPGNLGWVMSLTIVIVLWFTWFRAPRRFLERQLAPKLLPPWLSSKSLNYIVG